MKSRNIFSAACIVCLLAGCSTDKEKVGTGGAVVATPVPPEPRTLAQADLFKVEIAIYDYMLQPQFWTASKYTTVFVQGGDAEFNAVIQRFPNHVPPIKPTGRAHLLTTGILMDKDTGGVAILLSTSTGDALGDTVQAEGRWFASSDVSGFHTFTLQHTNGDWRIESVK